jgi:hypothetical protein
MHGPTPKRKSSNGKDRCSDARRIAFVAKTASAQSYSPEPIILSHPACEFVTLRTRYALHAARQVCKIRFPITSSRQKRAHVQTHSDIKKLYEVKTRFRSVDGIALKLLHAIILPYINQK